MKTTKIQKLHMSIWIASYIHFMMWLYTELPTQAYKGLGGILYILIGALLAYVVLCVYDWIQDS